MAIIGVACIIIVAWVTYGSRLAWGSTLGNIVDIVGVMVGSHVEHLSGSIGSSWSGWHVAEASWWSGTYAACGWHQHSCVIIIVIVVTLAVELSAITARSTTARRRQA